MCASRRVISVGAPDRNYLETQRHLDGHLQRDTHTLLFVMMLLLVAPLGLNAPVAELQRIVEGAARKYNCAVSLGMSNGKDLSHSLAAGTIDRFRERKAGPDDDFLWGSVTKTMTGAAILKLVAEGYVRLDDLAHHYVDPVLAQANYPYKTMEELFWADRWAIPPAAAFRPMRPPSRCATCSRCAQASAMIPPRSATCSTSTQRSFSPLDLPDISRATMFSLAARSQRRTPSSCT